MGRSSGRRTSIGGRTSGAWAIFRAREDQLGGRGGEVKIRRIRAISWMERWGKGEARSTQNKANPQIKSNKISTHQQITKKLGLFLWGIFELGTKSTKLG